MYRRSPTKLIQLMMKYKGKKETKVLMNKMLDLILVPNDPEFTVEGELYKCNRSIHVDEASELNSILLKGLKASNSHLYLGQDDFLKS